MSRVDRDEQFLRIAGIIAENSTCTRASVGAVIVRDRRIIAVGYNGSPPGMKHCDEISYGRKPPPIRCGPDECTNSIHAEANAIAWAARAGIQVEHATMYCTHGPCLKCAQLMLASGIEESHFVHAYRDRTGEDLLLTAGVKFYHHIMKL